MLVVMMLGCWNGRAPSYDFLAPEIGNLPQIVSNDLFLTKRVFFNIFAIFFDTCSFFQLLRLYLVEL